MGEINIELMQKDAPIGIFDSGVGGLTVVREIMRQIPNEKIIYFGDTARVPYGSKSQETVTRYSEQIVRFLRQFNVKTIVVACNTASAYALDTLEESSDIPIIGVVKPGGSRCHQKRAYRGHCHRGYHRQPDVFEIHTIYQLKCHHLRQSLPPLRAPCGGRAAGGSCD